MSDLKALIAKTASGQSLTEDEAESAFESIMSGGASHAQLASLLTAMAVRGETISEITGAARIMRSKVLPIKAPPGAIDTCGTGGDASGTFNISTAVAIVIAACGVPVAKHGNRKASSKSGTADVLEALGVNLNAGPNLIEQALVEVNLGFLFAQKHHFAMKHVAPVRAELGIRTIFNLLGPLSNPANAQLQLLGVFAADWLMPMAETLRALGSKRAWVVHGSDGLDELTITGPSKVVELNNNRISTFQVEPEEAGLTRSPSDELKGGEPHENAAALRALLDSAPGAYRDIVLLNAAAALIVAGKVSSLQDGALLAAAAIDDGRAKKTLERFAIITQMTN